MVLFFIILILFFSIVIHEYFHGVVAYKLGDLTPKVSGRLTLNPIAHIDPFGTIILPLSLLVITSQLGQPFSLGYAKPVPINPNNFKNPKKDMMWVGIAGPLSNLALALMLILFIKLNFLGGGLYSIFIYGLFINLILAIFNLLPIPPLDGSRIVLAFLPYKQAHQYLKLETYGFVIIISLIFLGVLNWFVFPIVRVIFYIFGLEFPLI